MYAKMTKMHRVMASLFVCVALVSCLSNRGAEVFDDAKFERSVGKLNRANIDEVDSKGYTHLHTAAKWDRADMAQFLLAKGANPYLLNAAGETPLYVAIARGNSDTAKVLAFAGRSLFAKNALGRTAIEKGLAQGGVFYDVLLTNETAALKDDQGRTICHYIAELNDLNALANWIKKGLPLSTADSQGVTPLALAFEKNNIDMAVALIHAGAQPVRGDTAYFQEAVASRNLSMRLGDGQTPLHIATIQGHESIVDYLLAHVLDVRTALDAQDSSGSTPLHEAARYGNKNIALKLLTKGANPNLQDRMGKTPLLLIIPREKQSEIYPLLLAWGAKPDVKDIYGDTALHIATINAVDVGAFAGLAAKSVDLNERNKQGATPLAVAVEQKNTQIGAWLVSHGADIHARDSEGRTPLTLAFASAPELVPILVTRETAVTRDSNGNTALHIAVENNSDYVRAMINLGVDVTAKNNVGDSALSLAVQNNQKEVGEMLLSRGGGAQVFPTNANNRSPLSIAFSYADGSREWILTSAVVMARDGTGNTALHFAAEWRNEHAVNLLLSKHAEINAKNVNGQTALYQAVRSNNPGTIKTLLLQGAATEGQDAFGNGILHHAVIWDAAESAVALVSFGVPIDGKNVSGKTALAEAGRADKSRMAALFVAAGANVNMADTEGRTVLMDAIKGANVDMVKLLLNNGALPQTHDRMGRSAYHDAVSTGNAEIISLIRDRGGNPLSRDREGITPLVLAFDQGDLVLKTVLGKDLSLIDSDGNTPIHVAIQNNASPEVLSTLIGMGYPVNWRNRFGETPLMMAVENKSLDIAVKLLKNGSDPFISDNSGECAATAALRTMKDKSDFVDNIARIAGNMTDLKGDGLLHYAAQIANREQVEHLLALDLDKSLRNSSGETPRDVAIRWQKPDVARVLQ
jgi:ankyrin repeat protein